MKSSMVRGFALVALLVLLGGCGETSDFPLSPSSTGVVAGSGAVDTPVSESQNPGLDAHGHITWQEVELFAPDGSTSAAAFRADYVVQDRGRARGNFAFFDKGGMVVYRITGGEVRCVEGTDVVVLNATAFGPDNQAGSSVTVNVTPAGEDDPDCIIWDIQDGCSHEATGKHAVLNSACDR